MNMIEQLFNDFGAKYLEEAKKNGVDLGLQTVYTPIDKIEKATGIRFADYITSETRSVAVLFNTEFIGYFIKELPQNYINNIKFTFFYDCEFDYKQVRNFIFFSGKKLKIDLVKIENIKDLDKIMAGKNFDIIYSNPPYDRSLHLKILKTGIKHLTNEGVFINVSPNDHTKVIDTFFSWGIELCTFILKRLKKGYIIDHETANKIFGNLGNGIRCDLLVGLYVKNEINEKIETSFDERLIDVCKKIFDHKGLRTKFKSIKLLSKNGQRIFRMHGDKNAFNAIICDEGRAKEGIEFNNENEKINFRNSIYCWPYTISWIFNGRNGINPAHVPWMGDNINPRTGLKGYKGEWTNEDFYKFFGITEEEQKYIEETMSQFK